jgi:hypothetical protein
MIKSLIALVALSTLCIPQVEAQAFNEIDLLEYHESKGGKVYADSPLCKETGAMGIQQGINVHICIDAHNGNAAEVRDTIRHEMWHVVQMCNRGPIATDKVMMIGEAYAKGWTGKGYDEDVWHFEAEAHFAASSFTPQEIKNALDRFCFS